MLICNLRNINVLNLKLKTIMKMLKKRSVVPYILNVLGLTVPFYFSSCGNNATFVQDKVSNEYVHTIPGNPYLPLWEHLPDGEPRVFEDPDCPGKYRVYVYGSHDVIYNAYCGLDIRSWSAPVEDLTQWRDEGPVFTFRNGKEWDIMYAPDLVEIVGKDGKKVYYLYPNCRGWLREGMIAKSDRPDGPFVPVNLSEDKIGELKPGSCMGFDPAVYIEYVTDENDPDYEIGFRAYGYWGFQKSHAAQLDQKTMYSVRPGEEVKEFFIPSSDGYGNIRDPKGTKYPQVYEGEDLGAFNFFEASSIRKVGNKYLFIYSGHSGPEYGVPSSNSTLRYVYGDTPLGPWKNGGILVDNRGIVPNKDGSKFDLTSPGHNTHGSIVQINDQWYVFYHRAPRGYGYARQPLVAPITIEYDEKPVAEGGKVIITGYDPYTKDNKLTAKVNSGDEYTGAELTSEGFHIYGLDPYRYYSAGYACYFSDYSGLQDSWDVWDNSMIIANVKHNDIVGFKYFGFAGLDRETKGLLPFEGAKPGNETKLNVFLTPKTDKSFKVNVWLDGPWGNETWKGTKIGEIIVPANSASEITKFQLDVASYVEGSDKKRALYLVAEGDTASALCDYVGIGFSSKDKDIKYPYVPKVSINIDNKPIGLPEIPARADNFNGITDFNTYIVYVGNSSTVPTIDASSECDDVSIDIKQAKSLSEESVVTFTYNGVEKHYIIRFVNK